MRYPTELPTADRQELQAAMTADDPGAVIDQHVAAIDGIKRWAEAENAKWQRARAALDMFGASAAKLPDTGRTEGRETVPDTTSATGPQINGSGARPKTRRAALLILFHEQPQREWRTRELAAELERRGWAGHSGNEANKVSRSLAAMVDEGEIVNVRKGVHKLRTQHPEQRPRTLEEAHE